MKKKAAEQEIQTKAEKVAVQYFKTEKRWKVEVDEVKISPITGADAVFVYGHIAGNKNKKVSVTVDYKNNYKVVGVGYDR